MANTEKKPVRIVIADDHPIFREGLKRLLETDPALSVVGQASGGFDAVRLVREFAPDILLLDFAMPHGSGLDALRELAELGGTTRTVLLTADIDRGDTVVALQLGARGVVLKESATDLLLKCIRSVAAGQYWVGHERVSDLVDSLRRAGQDDGQAAPASRLTRRELDIVAAIVEGAPNRDIAAQLGMSEQTVKNHLSHVFDKLGVSSRLELALYAMHHRLLANGQPPVQIGGKG